MAKRPKQKAPEPRRPAPYSPPAHAAQIWLDSHGNLCLGLPSAFGDQGHTVKLPANPDLQLKLLRKILLDRQGSQARIGAPFSPTSAMLEQTIAAWTGKITRTELRAEHLDDDDFRE